MAKVNRIQKIKSEYGGAISKRIKICCTDQYRDLDLNYMPEEIINASQGCSSPGSLADIKSSNSVLDLGCGAGLDVFVASKIVGQNGRVIGVDATPEMLDMARQSIPVVMKNLGYPQTNVEFVDSSIENISLPDESIDVCISNCVINLIDSKNRVFNEIMRVLRKGGYFTISDIFSNISVPLYLSNDEKLHIECIAGSLEVSNFLKLVRKIGFQGISKLESHMYRNIDANYFLSITLRGYKISERNDSSAYVTFRGPFREVTDELGNTYVRGEPIYVKGRVLDLLSLPPYHSSFLISPKPIRIGPQDKRWIGFVNDKKTCRYRGHYAMLIGPYIRAVDDENHEFYLGVEQEICEKSLRALSHPYYFPFFVTFNKSNNNTDVKEVCCADDTSCC